jgi:hypothetical protein
MMRWWAVVLVGLVATGCPAESKWEATADGAAYGNYVFRGARRGPLGIIASSYVAYTPCHTWSFHLDSWRWLQLANEAGIGEQRVTPWVEYRPSDLLELHAGYVHYDRRNQPGALFLGPDTNEAFAGVGLDLPCHPRLTAYYDDDNNVGTYVVGEVSHTVDVGRGWEADLSASVGWDEGRVKGFNDAHLRAGLRYPFGERLWLGPALDLWFPSNKVDAGADHFRPVLSIGFGWDSGW